MTRVLSGAVLIAFAVAAVWLSPDWLFFFVGEAVLLLAFLEYARLAEASDLPIPKIAAGASTLLACAGVASIQWIGNQAAAVAVGLDAILMSAFVIVAAMSIASWHGGRDALGRTAAALLPSLYLGLPVGAIISLRLVHGPQVLFLFMLTVFVSDTAQYYAGRAFGRRPLAPAISPKKTVEGAVGGFVFGALTLAVIGNWWLPDLPAASRAVLGVAVVALGIAGDLFESMLKRSADLKDSSSLIPGHGGILDRLDALLFAAPVYYIVLKYV